MRARPSKHPRPGGPSKGVEILRGDPKKAIIKMSLPMIAAMSAQTVYGLVDAIWVAGLGADALSAVGFFFPFFFLVMALGAGVGIGASAAVSRFVGAGDKEGTDDVASHSMVLMVIIAVAFTFPMLVFARPIFTAIGAGSIIEITVGYANIMFAGTIIMFFSNISMALLRGEGDANRAMYVMMIGSILNIILDPIFIYTLGLGVPGAAWATMISFSVSSMVLLYWLFIKKDTYMTFRFRGFRFKRTIIHDIFKVGLPASVMHMAMALTMFFMNFILVIVKGTDGVAIFSTGWRVAMIATLPLIGISMGVTAVTGAAFGMRDHEKLNIGFMYAMRLGTVIEVVMAVTGYFLAPYIAAVFTYSEDAKHLFEDLVVFLRIMVLFLPFISFGMLSSAMFQGTGKGIYALIVTFFRTLILTIPLAWFMGIRMGMGLEGIWWGMVAGNSIGAMVAFTWASLYIRSLRKSKDGPSTPSKEEE